MAAYEVLLLNTAVPQIQAAQAGDTYVVPRDIQITANLDVTGNTILGDASTDTVRVNGYMGVGGAGSTAAGLRVNSTSLIGVNQFGFLSDITATSAATNNITGYYTRINTAAATYTTVDVFNIQIRDVVKGAGHTITNQHGVYIVDQTQGTNNYGITSLVSSGANKWNIYASGTAANYFAGNVGIGTSTPQANLELSVSSLTTGPTLRLSNTNNTISAGGTHGSLEFWSGDESSPANVVVASMTSVMDATAPNRGTLVLNAGNNSERLRLSITEAVFNDAGDDIDFRVESDTNTHALFVQGSDGNVGIGTSSPGYKVDTTVNTNGVNGYNVYGAQGGASEQIGYRAVNANSTGIFAGVNGFNYSGSFGTANAAVLTSIGNVPLLFGANNTEFMRLNTSGNLGLGVTPSVWALSGLKAFQIKNGAIYGYNDDEVGVTANCSYDSGIGNWKYISTGSNSTRYRQVSGIHSWFTAPSGTAGNAISFTQRMTLTEAGNLGLGQTSPTAFTNYQGITTNGSVGSFIDLQSNGTTGGRLQCDTTYPGLFLQTTGAQPLVFATNATERARINATGDLVGAGTTSIIYWEGVYNNTTASAANMFVASNGSFARSTSALKYKQDIRNLENVDIDSIRAVRYKSKCDNDDQTKDHFGVIADEVDQAGIKELVNYGPNGEVEGFQYERLTVVLLKELQSLRARVAQLEGN